MLEKGGSVAASTGRRWPARWRTRAVGTTLDIKSLHSYLPTDNLANGIGGAMSVRIALLVLLAVGRMASAQCTVAGMRILHIGDSLTKQANDFESVPGGRIVDLDLDNGAEASTVIAQAGQTINANGPTAGLRALLAAQQKSIYQFDGVVVALGTNDATGAGLRGLGGTCIYCVRLDHIVANITEVMDWIEEPDPNDPQQLPRNVKVQWIVPHFQHVANSARNITAMQFLGAKLEVRAAIQEASESTLHTNRHLYATDFAPFFAYWHGEPLTAHLPDGTHMDDDAKESFAIFHHAIGGLTNPLCQAGKQRISAAEDAAKFLVRNHLNPEPPLPTTTTTTIP
jgi:lysophospholipase L1-like esterase